MMHIVVFRWPELVYVEVGTSTVQMPFQLAKVGLLIDFRRRMNII
jgi:hypothetical protein